MKTPGAARKRALSAPRDSSSYLNDDGGVTPKVDGKERAKTLPTSSKAPGTSSGVNTPVARKSILKVRFDPEMTGPMSELSDVLPHDLLDRPQLNGVGVSSGRPRTPEPAAPVTPLSRSPRKHRRSPSVRVVDAYGNEKSEEDRTIQGPIVVTPRSKSGVRILDALGREVKEEEQTTHIPGRDEEDISGLHKPTSQTEAWQRVRQGIQELAEGIESLDQYVTFFFSSEPS